VYPLLVVDFAPGSTICIHISMHVRTDSNLRAGVLDRCRHIPPSYFFPFFPCDPWTGWPGTYLGGRYVMYVRATSCLLCGCRCRWSTECTCSLRPCQRLRLNPRNLHTAGAGAGGPHVGQREAGKQTDRGCATYASRRLSGAVQQVSVGICTSMDGGQRDTHDVLVYVCTCSIGRE
jgi:hypothetical protein